MPLKVNVLSPEVFQPLLITVQLNNVNNINKYNIQHRTIHQDIEREKEISSFPSLVTDNLFCYSFLFKRNENNIIRFHLDKFEIDSFSASCF